MKNGQEIRPRHDDGKLDRRYTVQLEYCGAPTQKWVARFCDEWIGRGDTFAEGCEIAAAHNRERLA